MDLRNAVLVVRDLTQIARNISGLLAPHEVFVRKLSVFRVIQGQPFVYWWDDPFLKRYAETPKLGESNPAWQGVATTNNVRFLRRPWEVKLCRILLARTTESMIEQQNHTWAPYIKGAAGQVWIEPVSHVVEWLPRGWSLNAHLEFYREKHPALHLKDNDNYFRAAVAFTCIGSEFSARVHQYRSVIGHMGSSIFPICVREACCLMNSTTAKVILSGLNPGLHFEVGDVNRLPLFSIESADEIFAKLDAAFIKHEAACETSVEFKHPGPSAWNYTQEWAQVAVDRDPGTSLPNYQPVYDDPLATNYVSYAIGIALGRFGANGGGILNEAPATALPAGILYLSAYADNDSLQHPACQSITNTWDRHGDAIARGTLLHTWLRQSFFSDVHLGMYDNRPIYFPLSSQGKNFVALVSIHRWTDNTLQTLLAEYLFPELHQLEGTLHDLMAARNQGDREAQAEAEDNYSKAKVLYEELKTFVDLVQQCAESGPPLAQPQDTPFVRLRSWRRPPPSASVQRKST